jgi:hypothetical protein
MVGSGSRSKDGEREWFEEEVGELPLAAIRLLLEGVAPERTHDFDALFSELKPRFVVSESARRFGGFCALTDRSEIQIAPGARDALWFMSFSAWHSFRARIPQEFLAWLLPMGEKRDELLMSEDHGYQPEAVTAGELVTLAKQLMRGGVTAGTPWPASIPRADTVILAQDRRDPMLSVEHILVKDMALFAISYILLHEMRHLIFNASRAGIERKDEETACDQFAVEQILGHAASWASAQDPALDPERVKFKRSMGLLVGFFALHSMTPEGMRAESKDYPSLSQRLRIIVRALDLPEEHEFWLFGSSVLREMHQDSDYAIVGVNSETKSRETFLSLAERDFR